MPERRPGASAHDGRREGLRDLPASVLALAAVGWMASRGLWGVPRGVWALAAVGVGLRLAAVRLLFDPSPDAFREFGAIAENVWAGRGFAYAHVPGPPVPSAYMPPGYVALLVPFQAIADAGARLGAVLSFQAAVGGLTAVLAWAVARRWAGEAAGWAAAALFATLPALVASAAIVSPVAAVHAGALGAFALLAPRPERIGRAAALGGTLAGLVLLRSEMALFAALVVVLLGAERRWRTALVVALVVAAGVGPWIARNAAVLGRPALSTGLGFNLLRGHNPDFISSWTDAEAAEAVAALPLDRRFESRMESIYRARALDHIRDDPARSLRWGAVKVARLWVLDTPDPRAWHPLHLASVALFLTLTLLGALHARPPPEAWLYAATATLAAAVFFAFARHQVLLMGALTPVMGAGVAALLSRLSPHAQGA